MVREWAALMQKMLKDHSRRSGEAGTQPMQPVKMISLGTVPSKILHHPTSQDIHRTYPRLYSLQTTKHVSSTIQIIYLLTIIIKVKIAACMGISHPMKPERYLSATFRQFKTNTLLWALHFGEPQFRFIF